MRTLPIVPFLAAFLVAGCIRAPTIVVVDRATALEREAAGDFPKLEGELERAGTAPSPPALTRDQLEAAHHPRPIVEEFEPSDAERVDALLKAGCLGEALDGSLAETPDHCAVKPVPRLGSLVDRANRNRLQIWDWLRSERPGRTAKEVRAAWRGVHLGTVPCGGLIQLADGSWGTKKCD